MRALLVALLLTVATQAVAFCIEPTIFMSTPMKPSLPWCVNEWDNTHTLATTGKYKPIMLSWTITDLSRNSLSMH